jgi:hypothetical protein
MTEDLPISLPIELTPKQQADTSMRSDTDASLICRYPTPQKTRQGVPTFLRGLEALQHSPMEHTWVQRHIVMLRWKSVDPVPGTQVHLLVFVFQRRPCLPGEATYGPTANGSST